MAWFPALWFVDIRDQLGLPGRSAEATWILETLAHPDGVGALVGPTGMGVTTLAVAHAYAQRRRYPDGVALLRAGNEFTSDRSLCEARWGVPLDQWWTAPASVGGLLILDDVRDAGMVQRTIDTRGVNKVLLVTSAEPGLVKASLTGPIPVLDVGPLEQESAALALLQVAKNQYDLKLADVSAPGRASAMQLAHELGGIPILLAGAGLYAQDTGGGVARALDLYHQGHLTKAVLRQYALTRTVPGVDGMAL